MANTPNMQKGQPYLTIDPETGEQVYHEGDEMESSTVGDDFDALNFIKTIGILLAAAEGGAFGLNALAGAGAGAGVGAGASGAATAATAPTAATGAGVGAGLTPMTGVSFLPGAAPTAGIASGTSMAGAGAGAGAGISAAAKAAPLTGFQKFSIGADLVGRGLGAVAGQKNANEDREFQRERLAEDRRQFDAQLGQRRGENALEASQMDPLTQLKSRQRNALAEVFLSNYKPVGYQGGQFTGGFNGISPEMLQGVMPLYTPEARFQEEQRFGNNARQAAPGFQSPTSPQGYSPGAKPFMSTLGQFLAKGR